MLDDAAQEICVINTTLGRFKLFRLLQGMKHASRMFSEQSGTLSKDWLELSVSRTTYWYTEEQKVNVRSVGGQFRIACKTRGSP